MRHVNMGRVVDEVLAEVNQARVQREAEIRAVKTAEAQPRTEIARGLRALANNLRMASDDVTYADLKGTP